MDHPLKALFCESARSWLSTSISFEPFVPRSHQNAVYALTLLGSLAEVTQASFRQPIATPAPPPKLAVQVRTPQNLQDQSILNALLQLRKSGKTFRRNPGVFAAILRPTHEFT